VTTASASLEQVLGANPAGEVRVFAKDDFILSLGTLDVVRSNEADP
jgi:hypothetical protein